MRAVGYIRVSTTEQAREGYSLSSQEQAIRAYCEAHRWELVAIYEDAGKSGGSMKHREALQQLLTGAAGRQFERVVFLRLDRLGRSLKDLLTICDHLQTHGAEIVSIQEAIDTGTSAGRLSRSVLGAAAEFERDAIRERIKLNLAEKARQGGLIGTLPIGYTYGESRRHVVLDQRTAPKVLKLFNLYAQGGQSLRDLARWAASEGLRSTRGNPLDRLSVRKILSNSVYTGKVVHGRRSAAGMVTYDGQQPALVSQEVFDQVQAVLQSQRYSYAPKRPWGKEPYPLTGVAVCGHDGAHLLGMRAGEHNDKRYMRCSTAQRRGREACAQPMVKAELLEAQLGAYVSTMRLPTDYLREVTDELRRRHQVAGHSEDTGRLQREIDRWQRLFVLEEVDEERYRGEVAPLKRRLAMAVNPAFDLDVERAVSLLRDIGPLWQETDREHQREFIREVFTQIMVKGPQVMSITPKPIYTPLFRLDRAERFYGQACVIWLPEQDSNLQPAG